MKYALSFILFLFALSFHSLQATAQTEVSGDTLLDRFTISSDIFESSSIVGIGQMARTVRNQASPIQTLASIARPQEAARRAAAAARTGSSEGRMGARLIAAMSDTVASQVTTTVAVEDTLAVSTEIIDADTDVNTDTFQEGRMYTPKLTVDFQKFPVPTYAAMPGDVRQTRITKLNNQLQKRFGETVQIDYRENVHYLRGTVSSERKKEVLELFIKMEPGIQEVRNEVVVK